MYNHILIPVSFDEDDSAETLLAAASALTGPEGEVCLLHVMAPIPKYASDYFPEGYQDKAKREIEQMLCDIASGLPAARGKVVEGNPGRRILAVAKEIGADCIVIAAHRSGVADVVLGRTAAHVVRQASCAVHLARG